MMRLHEALNAQGIPFPPANAHPMSGGFIRYGKGNRYWLKQQDGVALFGDWSTGESYHWFENSEALSAEQITARKAQLTALRREEEAERIRQQEETAQKALEIWNGLQEFGQSEYLTYKQIKPHGIRFGQGFIAIPLRDSSGKIWSLQKIYDAAAKPTWLENGNKHFLGGSRIKGLFHLLGALEGQSEAFVCEGYATGASIYEAMQKPVFVAFNAGNLEPVVAEICKVWPLLQLTIAGDNDAWTEGNPGKTKAEEAANRHGCKKLVLPQFPEHYAQDKPTDWNDLHCLAGLEEVKRQLEVMPQIDLQTEVKKLAALSPLEYDRVRKAEAGRLGVRADTLDSEVKALRDKKENKQALCLYEAEPWPDPVNGEALLSDIVTALKRYLALPKGNAEAMALWAVFSHSFDAFRISPRLVFSSPEKRCGKTTALTLIGKLANRPLTAANITPAAIFRTIEAWQPTLLIDEADTFVKNNDDLRGILNAGHNRESAIVIRTEGDNHEPRAFSAWAPVAIAAIGRIPDTLEDRSIIIPMRRRTPDEKVERLRGDRMDSFNVLGRKIRRWVEDNFSILSNADPEVPEQLNDRAADNWRSLLAIADIAGGLWPKLAREAATTLASEDNGEDASAKVLLLQDMKGLFEAKGDRLASKCICDALLLMEERPWPEWRNGKPITPRQLAKLLEAFSIRPKTMRLLSSLAKGYERVDFEDAFSRYLGNTPAQSVTPLQTALTDDYSGLSKRNGYESVTHQVANNLLNNNKSYAVTDKMPLKGESAGGVEIEL